MKPDARTKAKERLIKNSRILDNGCVEYITGRTNHGYALVSIDWVVYSAHRLSWIVNRGEIPKGLCVLHRCDFRACVNPKHLFLGTKYDNIMDCIKKGRYPKAKLNPEKVQDIRALIKQGKTLRWIGNKFGVHHRNIWGIKHGSEWSHV